MENFCQTNSGSFSRAIGFEISLHAMEESAEQAFQTIGLGKSLQMMEEIAEQAFQTIRIGINHRAMDSIWILLTSLYIED